MTAEMLRPRGGMAGGGLPRRLKQPGRFGSEMRISYIHYLVNDDTALVHVREFVRGARSLGHEVDVHAMNLEPDRGAVRNGENSMSRMIRRILKRRFGRYLHEPKELLWNLMYARKEMALLRAAKPDVLLVRDHHLTASCVSVAKRTGLPLVIEMNAPAEQGKLYFDQYMSLPGVAGWLEAYKLRYADAVTVVSSGLKDHLTRKYAIPVGKLTLVPNGADPERFNCAVKPDAAVHAMVRGRPVVGFVGSFHKWHGAEVLSRMLEDVGRLRPQACFVIVGGGTEMGRLDRIAESMRDRLIMTGRVPHSRVPGIVAAIDIGVMPESNFYGSPLKVIEWMMAGKAVVAPAYAPLSDVIDHGTHGILFPPGDVTALVSAVVALIDDSAMRAKLGAAAGERASSGLTWKDNARRVLSACERGAASFAQHGMHSVPRESGSGGR